jgi:hypothetical protein
MAAALPCRLCRSVVFDEIRQLATAALSAADVVRRITLRRLKETFGHTHLQVRTGLEHTAGIIVRTPKKVGVCSWSCTWL